MVRFRRPVAHDHPAWQLLPPSVTLAVVLVASLSCTSPVDADHYPQGTLVVGTVRRGLEPVAGIQVRVWGFVPPCRQPELPGPALSTTADGRFRVLELSPYSPGTVFCGVARAYAPGPGGADSVTITGFVIRVAPLGSSGAPVDSTAVEIILPNSIPEAMDPHFLPPNPEMERTRPPGFGGIPVASQAPPRHIGPEMRRRLHVAASPLIS